MSEEFGATFITVTDDDGNNIELEYVDAVTYQDETYMAFFPADTSELDTEVSETELVILKSVQENGESILSTPDSEEEANAVYDMFMESLFNDEDNN